MPLPFHHLQPYHPLPPSMWTQWWYGNRFCKGAAASFSTPLRALAPHEWVCWVSHLYLPPSSPPPPLPQERRRDRIEERAAQLCQCTANWGHLTPITAIHPAGCLDACHNRNDQPSPCISPPLFPQTSCACDGVRGHGAFYVGEKHSAMFKSFPFIHNSLLHINA